MAEPTIAGMAQYAGPVALAAFGGVFLGGVALSFFWKNFGPWQLLAAANLVIESLRKQLDESAQVEAKCLAEVADLKARLEILMEAVTRGGLGLQLGPGQKRPEGLDLPDSRSKQNNRRS